MSVSADHVINGLVNYADNEIMGKLPTSGKWVMGTVIGVAATKTGHVIEELKHNAVVSMLGVIDESGNIDVDSLTNALRMSAEKYGNVTMEVPLVGRLTFSASDVEILHSYIS